MSHAKWSVYSASQIETMRQNLKQYTRDIADLDRFLEQAATLDIKSLRRKVEDLKRSLATDKTLLENWEQTVFSELLRSGVSDNEVDSAFRVLNPALLNLIVGQFVVIKDKNVVLDRIKRIAAHVTDAKYSDGLVDVDVSGLQSPSSQDGRNPNELQGQIAINSTELTDQEARLAIAADQEKARENLRQLQSKHQELVVELDDHDKYVAAWSSRSVLETQRIQTKDHITNTAQKAADLKDLLKQHAEKEGQIQTVLASLEQLKNELVTSSQQLQKELRQVNLADLLTPDSLVLSVDDAVRPQSIQAFAKAVKEKLTALSRDVGHICEGQSRLRQLQDAIVETSQRFEGQHRYFNNVDETWESLIEHHESLSQMEQVASKNWNDLITTLGAKLNGIVTAVRNVKSAVESINRGLKQYQVSNLRSVAIRVEEEHDTFEAVKTLADATTLFSDPEGMDQAKKKLRMMIDRNEPIELEALFELRIEIEQSDGTRKEATSLDKIGSTGTGMTAKAMIFIQLVRAIATNVKYRLHFYIDGLGDLDDHNLSATVEMAIKKGIIPITADPRIHLEPLAHPELTVYSLAQSSDGRVFVDASKTFHARRRSEPAVSAQ